MCEPSATELNVMLSTSLTLKKHWLLRINEGKMPAQPILRPGSPTYKLYDPRKASAALAIKTRKMLSLTHSPHRPFLRMKYISTGVCFKL